MAKFKNKKFKRNKKGGPAKGKTGVHKNKYKDANKDKNNNNK